jgi:hypothetical protein
LIRHPSDPVSSSLPLTLMGSFGIATVWDALSTLNPFESLAPVVRVRHWKHNSRSTSTLYLLYSSDDDDYQAHNAKHRSKFLSSDVNVDSGRTKVVV